MKSKISPRPWEVTKTLGKLAITIPHERIGIAFDTVCRMSNDIRIGEPEANAHHIVRCVNHFDEVVEALKKADRFITNGEEFGYIIMPDQKDDSAWETLPMIRQAISKATKK